jgi:hypothetical protein
MTENNQLEAPQEAKEIEVIEKDNRICRFCGEIKTESHHCSGKKAFQFGYNKAIEDYAKGEK